jgi:ribokinase
MSNKTARVMVIGSYAVGMTMGCARFPREGETVMGRGFQLLHGGKGSNQAIAVARLGGSVTFGASLGNDSFGQSALEMLKAEGIDTTFVKRIDGVSTGVGFVIVSDSGNNEIVIDLAANERLLPADIDGMADAIAASDLLLVQLEVNKEAVIRAIEMAHQEGTKVILNPAPFQKLPDEIVRKTTYLTPNETEAAAMLGLDVSRAPDGRTLAHRLYERYEVSALVTLGEKGAYVRTGSIDEPVPGFKARVVDTTGAGDSFSGALAVALGEGKPLLDAVRFANRAASMSVEVEGVVPSIPRRAQVEARIREKERAL